MQLTRLMALFACFASGASVPLVTMAAEHEAVTTVADAGIHTSSRAPVFQVDVSDAELERLRAQLWALTRPGGTVHCNEAGINAPCVDTVSFN